MSAKRVTVIGGGPGGYVCAVRLAQLGAEVTLIEKDYMGGTCLNRGCIPTKSLLHSAALWEELHEMPLSGIRVDTYQYSWRTMMGRKNRTVQKLRASVERLMKKWAVQVKGGRASITPEGKVLLNKADGAAEELEADAVVIATGTVPSSPPLALPQGYQAMTTDELLDVSEVPKSLAIIGGGVIGIEMASLFSRLGSSVEIIEILPEILAQFDEDLRKFIEGEFLRTGVGINKASQVTAVTGTKGALKIKLDSGKTIEAAEILVATGRRPQTEGLLASDIAMDKRGYIQVDRRLCTSKEGIYAVGDVTGQIQLAHVASAQGICCAEAIAGLPYDMDYSVVPACVFSSPELASVGLTEQEAKERGEDVKVARFPFAYNGKAVTEGDTRGFIKIIAHKKNHKILGVHIAGNSADALIHEGALAIRLGATIEQLARTIHAHPTRSEGIAEAAESVLNNSIYF